MNDLTLFTSLKWRGDVGLMFSKKNCEFVVHYLFQIENKFVRIDHRL